MRTGEANAAQKRIFGILGEKVGVLLPPTNIVPTAGLVPWTQLETQVKPV